MPMQRARPIARASVALAAVAFFLLAGVIVGLQPPLHAGGQCSPPDIFDPQTETCVPPPSPVNPARLIVTKVVLGGPAAPSDFAFLVTVGAVPVTGQQSPAVGQNSTTFLLTFNATVTVEETVTQPDYVADNSNCTNVVVALGQTSACTITNTYQPPPPPVLTTLTVAKLTTPASSTAFAFTGSVGGLALADGETSSFTVTPGAHFVQEALPADWRLDSISCDGNDPGVVTGTRVDLVISAGENVVCTFRNRMTPPPPPPLNPSLTVQKLTNGLDVDPNSGDLPELVIGDDVVWTYIVTNTGDVALFNVQVVDDAGTPQDPRDDFVALGGASLEPGASLEATASGLVVDGPYVNRARASAQQAEPVTAARFAALRSNTTVVSASDASGYLGIASPPPPPIPDPPAGLPDAGSGGVPGSLDSFGWRLSLSGLVAVSLLSFVAGLQLLRRRR